MVEVLGNPEQRLQIAQTALAFFDIWLDQISRAAVTGMPGLAFGQLGFDKLGAGPVKQFAPQPVFQLVGQQYLRVKCHLFIGMAADQM